MQVTTRTIAINGGWGTKPGHLHRIHLLQAQAGRCATRKRFRSAP
jgi:hypothetical protein